MQLRGEHILVVEDEILVATHLAELIGDAGAVAVGPAESTARALQLIEDEIVTAAILDVNVRDGDVTPVAARLTALKIPFVLHTGCPLPVRLRAQFGSAPVLTKPCRSFRIIDALTDIVAHRIANSVATTARPERLGHVLLIEDEESTAIILEAHMRAFGFESCEQVDTEEGAIQAARRRKPDFMLVDIRLREGNGIAAAAAIDVAHGVPMVVVTAYPPDAVGIERALVVKKPFTTIGLESAVLHARSGH